MPSRNNKGGPEAGADVAASTAAPERTAARKAPAPAGPRRHNGSGKGKRHKGDGSAPGVRELSAQATREAILHAAIEIFAQHGYAGGRIEQISRAANSHDRMIYYYFESKEGLFIAVLEEMYRRMNAAEEKLALRGDRPVESLATIVRFVVRYYQKNPEFVTLLSNENLHRGEHIAKSQHASEFSSRAISLLEGVLASGSAQGVFRADASPRDIYLMITSMGYFPMANRHTLKSFLGQPTDTPGAIARWESFLIDAVMRVLAPVPATSPALLAAP